MTDITVNTKVPTMCTIRQASREVGIPEHFLRQLVKQKKVVHCMAGSKALVNLEKLVEYLNTGDGVRV